MLIEIARDVWVRWGRYRSDSSRVYGVNIPVICRFR